MKSSSSSPVAAAVMVLVAFASLAAITAAAGSGGKGAEAAACNPTLLTPCAGPVLFGGPVPPACCAQLRAQQGCLCGYARSPNYGSYVHSPNAARLFTVCRIPKPRCA